MFDESSLRKNRVGNQVPWTTEELLAGFQYFYQQYGKYPSAHEVDAFEYLPSSRSIQRSYGGLQELRKRLLPDEINNYTKGEYRSKVARATFANGRTLEALFFEYLTSVFSEISVHEHKLIRPGNVNSDYYIYLNDQEGVVIDIFYAESITNLVNVVNIKLKRYSLVTQETYLVVVGNDLLRQEDIELKTKNRQIPLPRHIHVVSELFFKTAVINQLKSKSNYLA